MGGITINKEITLGNLASVALVVVALVVGYTRLQAAAELASQTAAKAVSTANSAHDQIHKLETSIEVIKTTTANIEKSVDEIKLDFRQLKNGQQDE